MIQNENQSADMFKVVKQLKIPLKRGNKIIHNQMVQRIINKNYQYNEIKKHFRTQI